jgi:dCMP deaminase
MANQTRPSWDEYFLEIAGLVAKRSPCLRRNYGAVIVKDNIIISTGYNGAARGEPNCIDTTGMCAGEI